MLLVWALHLMKLSQSAPPDFFSFWLNRVGQSYSNVSRVCSKSEGVVNRWNRSRHSQQRADCACHCSDIVSHKQCLQDGGGASSAQPPLLNVLRTKYFACFYVLKECLVYREWQDHQVGEGHRASQVIMDLEGRLVKMDHMDLKVNTIM